MTTQEILSEIESLSLAEKVSLVEVIMELIGEGIKDPEVLMAIK